MHRIGQLGHGRRRRIVGAGPLGHLHDKVSGRAGFLYNRGNSLRGEKQGEGDTGNAAVPRQTNHVVRVPADYHRGDDLGGHVQLAGNEDAESRGVQYPAETHHARARHARLLHEQAGQGIHRLGGNDHGGVRRQPGDLRCQAADQAGVGGEQVFPAHARGADCSCCHHHELRSLYVLDGVRAGKHVAVPADGGGFHDVEHFAPCEPGLNIDEQNVGDALFRNEKAGIRPDVAAPDDAHTRHVVHLSARKRPRCVIWCSFIVYTKSRMGARESARSFPRFRARLFR